MFVRKPMLPPPPPGFRYEVVDAPPRAAPAPPVVPPPPKPTWSVALFDPISDCEPEICLSFFLGVPWLIEAVSYGKIRADPEAPRTTLGRVFGSYSDGCGAGRVLACCTPCCGGGRQLAAGAYGIRENPATSCLLGCCCGCCSSAQVLREIAVREAAADAYAPRAPAAARMARR